MILCVNQHHHPARTLLLLVHRLQLTPVDKIQEAFRSLLVEDQDNSFINGAQEDNKQTPLLVLLQEIILFRLPTSQGATPPLAILSRL